MHIINPSRQIKKEVMQKMKITGKQFRKELKKNGKSHSAKQAEQRTAIVKTFACGGVSNRSAWIGE